MRAKPPRSEAELLERAARLAGRTLEQLAADAGRPVPADQKRMKGWVGDLIEQHLGADAGSLAEPDFRCIGVEMKTIPVNVHARPKESTYVCHVPLAGDPCSWDGSIVRRKLARVLWVPIEGAGAPLGSRRIGNAFLWSPTPEQEKALRADWEDLTAMIALGELEKITARYGRYLQIRPKAANARSLTPAHDRAGAPLHTLPRGFYLRPAFTRTLLEQEWERRSAPPRS